MTNSKMEAEIIFESHIPIALRRALEHAGDEGFVASMPALLHARANADYNNVIWNTWFTANSEESVVTTPHSNVPTGSLGQASMTRSEHLSAA